MKKGYKFTEEQLAQRRKAKKGRWSKRAKERQSVRMKAFWQARKDNGKPIKQDHVVSIQDRLTAIEHHAKQIRKQLGLGGDQ
jgi:hypothetical protein